MLQSLSARGVVSQSGRLRFLFVMILFGLSYCVNTLTHTKPSQHQQHRNQRNRGNGVCPVRVIKRHQHQHAEQEQQRQP